MLLSWLLKRYGSFEVWLRCPWYLVDLQLDLLNCRGNSSQRRALLCSGPA